MTKQEAKIQISKLIDKYKGLVEAKKVKSYNEAQTRNEFIEPLFEFLGWDMRNLENPNEVITEESVSNGRVDLSFQLNHIPVMFLEAKALKVDLDEWKWAEQAINYSWNKSVTWAILTDFEGIKVFNAEVPPKGLSQNLFFELKWDEYLDNFDQLWLLSKESFEEKLLEKQAEKWGKLIKRKQVGEKLFEDLTNWRTKLTKDFKNNNDITDQDVLDESVQKVLDRLIFIRTAEDRGIEKNILLSLVREWESAGKNNSIYKRLVDGFRWFDENYNSKLFASHVLENWNASNDVLKDIINGFYQTADGYRYDFSAISTDVLGGIYEQYLGYVQGKAQKDENKKSKRKSQGIYYTPKYIVEYLVEQTLGEVLKKAKKKDLANIKILDPACGSGSFLISAYDRMLSAKHKLDIQTGLFDTFEILKNNIYGVDLDEQAIEIAQLNLLLRVLSKRTKLPTLAHNIRMGNSLVEGETEDLQKYFGDKWRDQKAFNWKEEFKEVFDQGGFDVIIGNPPYVRNRDLPDNLKKHYKENFSTASGQYDIYQLFFEKAISLLKEGGYLGFITSNKYAIASYGEKLREFILDNCKIVKIVDISNINVFKDASTYPYVIILQKKGKINKNHKIKIKKIYNSEELLNNKYEEIEQSVFENNQKKVFTLKKLPTFFKKIERLSVKLGEIATIKETIHTGNVRSKLIVDAKIDNTCKKLLAGRDCHRYWIKWSGKYIRYDKSLINKEKGEYGNLCEPKYFDNPKILLREIANKIECHYEKNKYYTLNKVYAVLLNADSKYSYLFLTALLNSKLLTFYFKEKFEETHIRGGYLQFKKMYTSQLPVVKVSEKKQSEIAKFAEQMIDLQKELQKATENTDKYSRLKTEIEKLDEKIDKAVYKLYELSDEEIEVIEGRE